MKPLSTFEYLKLSWFSKPACNRRLLQLIKKEQCQSFLEIGLGDGIRCQQMLRVAGKYSDKPIRYTGIDMFDAREGQTPLKLIEMHKVLNSFDVKSQLVPGQTGASIERIANSHLRTDLIVVSGETDRDEIESAIAFFPRMLHANSCLLYQPTAGEAYKVLNRLDVERWVAKVAGCSPSTATKAA